MKRKQLVSEDTETTSDIELTSLIQKCTQLSGPKQSRVLFTLAQLAPHPVLRQLLNWLSPQMKLDFSQFPMEIAYKIFTLLDLKSLYRCMQTCKHWLHIIESEGAQLALWKKRVLSSGWINSVSPLESPWIFKPMFKSHHETRSNWISGKYRQLSFPGHGGHVVTCLQFDSQKNCQWLG